MAIDITNVLVSATIVLISVIIFTITISIYRRTKGGSHAFKYWAIACGCYVIERSVALLLVLIAQEQNVIMSVVGEGLFKALASFFVMLGMLFLASDLKLIKGSTSLLRKVEMSFVMLFILIFFGLLFYSQYAGLTDVQTVTLGKSIGSSFEVMFWTGATVSLFLIYKTLKQGSRGWTLLFVGAAIVALNNVIQLFLNLGYTWLDTLDLVTSIPYAILLIVGFFLIDRSMKG